MSHRGSHPEARTPPIGEANSLTEALVALLDPARGEAVKAWVVCRPGASLIEDEVRAYCKPRLAPYKVPSQVEFRQELPKSPVGKVLRRAQRAEAFPTSA